MPAGTIALTNNSTSVVGTGTDFESELNANDFIVITVGGETYTLGVAAISSGTALTLIRPFSGPTTSGIAWGVVPANTMVRIAAELAEQTTFALRANNIAKINWNAVFSESGDITVTLLDGTTFNGPSWKKIVDLLAEIDVENLQQLVDQIHTDAEQVATDKTAASNAASSASASATAAGNYASSAQTAKAAAETANTNAQQAKTDAVAAKAAAEAAAANIPSMDNIDAHLATLGFVGTTTPVITDLNSVLSYASCRFSFSASAANLPAALYGRGIQIPGGTTGAVTQVIWLSDGSSYSRIRTNNAWGGWVQAGGSVKTVNSASPDSAGNIVLTASDISTSTTGATVESALTAFGARIGYSLVTTTSNMALNSRVVLQNPFGANIPVICFTEIYHATLLKWMTTSPIYSTSGGTRGVAATYAQGEGIILRSGAAAFVTASSASLASQEITADYTTPSAIRVHVFKVAA